MKLELKHLAPYLPYKLQIHCKTDISKGELFSLASHGYNVKGNFDLKNGTDKKEFMFIDFHNNINIASPSNFKPILRPLSDLSKEVQIAEYYMTFREHLNRLFPAETTGINLATWSQRSFEWVLKHHFDVFGLIDQGIAIDINTSES